MRNIIISMMVLAIVTTQSFAQSASILLDGKTRNYIVYAPTGLPANPPLVLALHPLGATNTQFRTMSSWDAIADKNKIVVVYPQGITSVTISGMSPMIGWDITGQSDVNFILAIIDTMTTRYKIDHKRIYSTGFSMGGMLSYVLACQKSDLIAAIGPDAGYPVGQNANSCKPSRQVPVCHVHGADDNFVAISDLPPWIKKFVDLDKCQSAPKTTTGAKYKKEDYSPCDSGNEVICYTITGMGHDYATASKYSFSATDTFWAFFNRHPGPLTETKKSIQVHRAVGPFSATYSVGRINLIVNREINSVGVFDVHGRTIYTSTGNESAGQASNIIVPVGRSSGGIYIIKIAGPAGVCVGRVLVH